VIYFKFFPLPDHPCPHGSFQCHGPNHCISKNFVCDDYPDCEDGSDEENCRK